MKHNFSRTQSVQKAVVETQYGVVAAQHSLAAQAGADVLAAGGDAVDAAVAVSFAMGVLEPWMSGPAGGGAMMLWRADEQKAVALNYGMRSPMQLNPADYPIVDGAVSDDLFPWDKVKDDRNVQGATAIAVPGLVDGVGQAHGRYGKLPWADLLQPAIAFAQQGALVDWYAALVIASATRALAQDEDAAKLFLQDGQWPTIAGWTSTAVKRLDQSTMANSLEQLARKGARELYDGELAETMVADVQAKGGSLSMQDLRDYSASFEQALSFGYRDAQFHVLRGLTAGPTFKDALAHFETVSMGDSPGPEAYSAYASGLKLAYAQRLSNMGDTGETEQAPGCTTHFSVVDKHGNMVSQTQTLLSIFGSRVVSPSTGFLMNNGVMWFDPVQGRANSLQPNKRCLMNVCPILGEQGQRRFAFGASGGRKIVSAMAQMSSFVVDFGMDVNQCFHQPRIDVSGGDTVVADDSLSADVLQRLSDEHTVQATHRTVFPYAFACPAGVMQTADVKSGCTEIMSPWGDAVAEKGEL